jgi:hypothetical protein
MQKRRLVAEAALGTKTMPSVKAGSKPSASTGKQDAADNPSKPVEAPKEDKPSVITSEPAAAAGSSGSGKKVKPEGSSPGKVGKVQRKDRKRKATFMEEKSAAVKDDMSMEMGGEPNAESQEEAPGLSGGRPSAKDNSKMNIAKKSPSGEKGAKGAKGGNKQAVVQRLGEEQHPSHRKGERPCLLPMHRVSALRAHASSCMADMRACMRPENASVTLHTQV